MVDKLLQYLVKVINLKVHAEACQLLPDIGQPVTALKVIENLLYCPIFNHSGDGWLLQQRMQSKVNFTDFTLVPKAWFV